MITIMTPHSKKTGRSPAWCATSARVFVQRTLLFRLLLRDFHSEAYVQRLHGWLKLAFCRGGQANYLLTSRGSPTDFESEKASQNTTSCKDRFCAMYIPRASKVISKINQRTLWAICLYILSLFRWSITLYKPPIFLCTFLCFTCHFCGVGAVQKCPEIHSCWNDSSGTHS